MASSDSYIRDLYRQLTGQEITGDNLDILRNFSDQQLPNAIGQLNSGTLSVGGTSLDAYLSQKKADAQLQAIVNMKRDQEQKVADFLKENPFAYDEAWLTATKQQVQEEVDLDPYYKEKVSNYLDDVQTTKSRANEDEATILKELDRKQGVYLKDEAATYQQARENALEGLTQANLLDTGVGKRASNVQEIQRETGIKDYLDTNALRKQQAQQTTQRLFSDLERDAGRFTTGVEREKALNVQSELQTRKQEALDQYQQGFLKATGQVIPGLQYYLG